MHMSSNNRDLRRNYYYSPRQQYPPTLPVKTSRSWVKPALCLGAAIGVGVLAFNMFHHPSKNTISTAARVAEAAATETTAEKIVPTTSVNEMASQINQVLAANTDTDVSIAIIDLKANQAYRYGPKVVYEAASVAKVITAITYLHQVQAGDTNLTKNIGGMTAQENMRIMIEQSDNAAWQRLNDFVTHASLLSYATSLGIHDYDPDVNTLSADDIAQLLAKLYQGKLLNHQNTQLLLGFMKNANQTTYIKPALPNDVNFYHKAGWLEDRAHDAAVIDNGANPYVLVIFTNGQNNTHTTDRAVLMQQVTKATVAHFISKDL